MDYAFLEKFKRKDTWGLKRTQGTSVSILIDYVSLEQEL